MSAPISRPTALAFAALLAACSGDGGPKQPTMPQLPPLQLVPTIESLKETAQQRTPGPAEAVKKELQDYADIVLQITPTDERTTGRAERSLLDSDFAGDVLVPMLKHEDAGVRSRTAWLLGRTGRSILQFAVVLRLKDETDAEACLWLADAAHRLGNDSGLVWLDAGMNAEATQQRAGELAIGLLKEDGEALPETPTWADLQHALRKRTAQWLATGVGCRDGVAPPDPQQVAAICASHLAITESFLLRPIDEAKYVLKRAGVLGLPTVERGLRASEPYLRSVTIDVATALGPMAKSLGPALLPLVGDPLTSSYAMRALGSIGYADALPHLRARLDSVDTELRATAAEALGLAGDAATAERLRAAMNDAGEAMDVRVKSAFALLCFHADAAAEAFLLEREQKGDFHAPALRALRDVLAQKAAARGQ